VWVVAGWMLGDVGVGGRGSFAGRGYGGFCFRLVWLVMGYSGVGCKIDAMCGWGWTPRFALEDVELVGFQSLCEDLTCFTSGADCAGC